MPTNLEAGIRRAMIATLKEAGASQADAETRADAKLADAVTLARGEARTRRGGPPRGLRAADAEIEALDDTLQAVKAWTLANA